VRTALAILAVGIVLVVAPLVGSAATAGTPTPAEPTGTLAVGVQGPGDSGQVVVYEDGEKVLQRGDAVSYHDVSWVNDTHLLATYADGTDDCERYGEFPGDTCAKTGFRIIDTDTNTIVREWTFETRTLPNSEVHDAEALGDGRVLVADMDRERDP